jgi:hypothetical protein
MVLVIEGRVGSYDLAAVVGSDLQVAPRLLEHQIAGVTRREQVRFLPLREGEVPAGQRVGLSLVDRHVRGRAAAVPVIQLLERLAQRREDGAQRFVVGPAGPA